MQIHNLLEIAAERNPEKNAVWFNNEWKTYYELNSMANKIAHYLFSIGVTIGDRCSNLT